MAQRDCWQGNRRVDLSAREFRQLFREVISWGRWGDRSEVGALNYLTAERIAAAARLVHHGVTVSLGRPLNTQGGVDNPEPAHHVMTMLTDVDIGSGSVRFAKDYVGVDYHNEGHSHIDALCHVAYDGFLYGGRPDAEVTSRGAAAGAIELLHAGLVGRGVLLDVPRVRGIRWLEPGEYVFVDDLEAAERAQGVSVDAGDILLVRTGHAHRLAELEPWDTSNGKAGLHPSVARFLADRRVAALGSDGNNDTAPSTTEGVAFPIHVLAVNAMGIHLLDYLQFEELVQRCEEVERWEFLFVAAPLRIEGGTGSPVNPIALL
ncbi:MAG TPA: cyclase family protein [Acidimicrobiales bacterium]|nr:cyclase family protein [Acidimicrobiales bacterium]